MLATSLLQTLLDTGISLKVSGDHLVARPASRLTDGLRAAIRQHKAELLAVVLAAGDDWDEIQRDHDTLAAFVHAVQTRLMREQGHLPAHYTQSAHCEACGPVWLWQGAPEHVYGCPWCFNRVNGQPIPRPDRECRSAGGAS